MGIGKLKEVDIRELWKHEQYGFSEWLSKKENIEKEAEEGAEAETAEEKKNAENREETREQ